jgi:hypothetical protein
MHHNWCHVGCTMGYPGLEHHLKITATPFQLTIMPSINYRNQAPGKDSSSIAFLPGPSYLVLLFYLTSFLGEFS